MIKLFDSLLHPTLSGKWPSSQLPCSFEHISSLLQSQKFIGGCAVGLWNVEQYDHHKFIQRCSEFPSMVPIAGVEPFSNNLTFEMQQIKQLGFKGVKIHPRKSRFNLHKDEAVAFKIFSTAASLDLPVFLCTFASEKLGKMPSSDPYWDLVKLLNKTPETKLILLHGGVTQLLQYAELVSQNANLLLDLSFTLQRYKDSSLFADMKLLAQQLDQRICIGSDYPDYTPARTYEITCKLCTDLPKEKINNICYKNLMRFLKLKCPT